MVRVLIVNTKGLVVKGREWRDYIHSKNFDLCFMLESHYNDKHDVDHFWGRNFFNSFSSNGRRNGIFVWCRNDIIYANCELVYQSEGEILVLDLTIEGKKIRFICLYLNPSFKKRWKKLLKDVNDWLLPNTFLLGDFNFVEYPEDRSSYKRDPFASTWSEFWAKKKIILQDVLLTKGLDSHTYHGSGSSSRIDRIYIYKILPGVIRSVKILPLPRRNEKVFMSDHNPILLDIGPSKKLANFKPAYWRFNNDYLMDISIRKRLGNLMECSGYPTNGEWRKLVFNIKYFICSYIKGNEIELEKEDSTFFQIRSGAGRKKEAYARLYRELPSSISSNWLYYSHSSKYVSSLVIDEQIITNQREILNLFENYYRTVFETDIVYNGSYPALSVLSYIGNGAIQESLAILNMEDLNNAITYLGKDKAPGPDGISNELLKGLISARPEWFLDLYNRWWGGVNIPKFVKKCYISLIPKVNYPTVIKEWRPISLLNNIFKIYTKMVKNRLLKLVDKHIHVSQTGFRKRRWIQENLVLLRIIWDKFDGNMGVVDADIENAFPSLSHNFLLYVIEEWLGLQWKELIQNVLGSEIAVIVNGVLTKTFYNKRGVLQGDSLAPLLFIIAINPFLIYLHRKDSFKFCGLELSSSSFADDLVKYILNAGSVRRIMNLFKKFECSGLKINSRKTKIVGRFLYEDNRGLEIVSRQRFLGLVWDTERGCYCEGVVMEKVKERFVALKNLKSRYTLQGLVNCINSYAFPILLYFARVQRLSEVFFQEYKNLCYSVINKSGSKAVTIRWERLIADRNKGGYGLLDPEKYNVGALMAWVPFMKEWLEGNGPDSVVAPILLQLSRKIRTKYKKKIPIFMAFSQYKTKYKFLEDLNWASNKSFFYWDCKKGDVLKLWNRDDSLDDYGICKEIDGAIIKVDEDDQWRDSCMVIPYEDLEDMESFLLGRIMGISTAVVDVGEMPGRVSTKLSAIIYKEFDFVWTSAQKRWLEEYGFNYVDFLERVKKARVHTKTFYCMKDIVNMRLRTRYTVDICSLCQKEIHSAHFLWDCDWIKDEWREAFAISLEPAIFMIDDYIVELCAYSVGAWYYHSKSSHGSDFNFAKFTRSVIGFDWRKEFAVLQPKLDFKM
jgi:hypothetical protein